VQLVACLPDRLIYARRGARQAESLLVMGGARGSGGGSGSDGGGAHNRVKLLTRPLFPLEPLTRGIVAVTASKADLATSAAVASSLASAGRWSRHKLPPEMVVAMFVPADQLVTSLSQSSPPSARGLLRELLKRLVVRYGSELQNVRQGEGPGQDTGVTVSGLC
jgi:hypothetical protein